MPWCTHLHNRDRLSTPSGTRENDARNGTIGNEGMGQEVCGMKGAV